MKEHILKINDVIPYDVGASISTDLKGKYQAIDDEGFIELDYGFSDSEFCMMNIVLEAEEKERKEAELRETIYRLTVKAEKIFNKYLKNTHNLNANMATNFGRNNLKNIQRSVSKLRDVYKSLKKFKKTVKLEGKVYKLPTSLDETRKVVRQHALVQM
ncbi:unnamed protein product [Caenorhabditis bovis]|uniref:Uncharacterized protein n=1 Tax=Caenorhabditis bovis TaxID=2654633 RepID=A0A8S1FAZ2_9PELO|nr:unnamed protein product [Caenorhabditis bovis]